MPPRKKVSAPANRVYTSRIPLSQTKFMDQRRRVTYGKKTTLRLPKQQETLTQIWDADHVDHLPENEDEKENLSVYENELEIPKKKRRKTTGEVCDPRQEEEDAEDNTRKLKKKRRKTTGDMDELQNEEDVLNDRSKAQKKKPANRGRKAGSNLPSKASESQQTITQLDWGFTSTREETPEEASVNAPQEEIEDDNAIYDVPSSSQSFRISSNISKLSKPTRILTPIAPQDREMGPPQTPRRILMQEIPSSQSPATPASLQSRGSGRKSSPLKEIFANTPISFNLNREPQKSPSKLPKLEIEDTFDTATDLSQQSRIPSTPIKKSSPSKTVRFAIPDDVPIGFMASKYIEEAPQKPTQHLTTQASVGQNLEIEIMDSDAESGFEEGEGGDEEEPISKFQNQDKELSVDLDKNEEEFGPETCYGEIGQETQFEAERIFSSPPARIVEETQAGLELEEAAETIQEKTQFIESQRLSTQYVNAMAPRDHNSDIFISLHPQKVTNILNRTKDHETRIKPFAPTVRRFWIYETAPVCALKYMAVISQPKRPGEIEDESGEGNAMFNAKKDSSWVAYEILELYELADPMTLSQLKEKEWLMRAPQRSTWVRPAVLDELMANLLPPVFVREASKQDHPFSLSSDTQEAAEQLMSTMHQFTQVVPSSQPQSSQVVKYEKEPQEEVVPSSQQDMPDHLIKYPGLSQASTVDYTQTQTPRSNFVAEIVWESPSRPVQSSTPIKLPTPRSEGSDDHQGPDSLVPFSMASSQLLSKSQMLPDSLLEESVPGPVIFIQDSDEEDSDDL